MENAKRVSYRSEGMCSWQECSRKARYRCTDAATAAATGKLRCGVHSASHAREKLPVNPAIKIRKRTELKAHLLSVKLSQEENKKRNKRGALQLYRIVSTNTPVYPMVGGWRNIIPTLRHASHEKYGLGMLALSPRVLGPVEGAPTLAAFQYASEKYETVTEDQFLQDRRAWFRSGDGGDPPPPPFRHPRQTSRDMRPEYFAWVDKLDPHKTIHKLPCIDARQFMCTFYERLAAETAEYKMLERMLEGGVNLQICGFEAEPMDLSSIEAVWAAYLSDEKPFGHERVLATMLAFPDACTEWPWRKFRTFIF